MPLCVLLSVLLKVSVSFGFSLGGYDDNQILCSGREFRLPVYSRSRNVTFTPTSPPGPRRVLLENNDLKDPRFEWTSDGTLLLKEVTNSDTGLYSIKLSSGFTYETVRLTVSECIKTFRRGYGETFRHNIPSEGSLLEFSPRGLPSEHQPVVVWNRTDPEASRGGRGRLQQDGKVWVAERVTQADQGNYTLRDENGKILTRSTLAVHGHSFHVTRFIKESLNLPLFLPVTHVHLIFTPTLRLTDGPLDSQTLRSTPVQLIRDGKIVEQDSFRNFVSLGRNGNVNEVVIGKLNTKHDGTYEIKDQDGNLVSSTFLQIIDRAARWRSVLRSLTFPLGMFVSLAGFILILKLFKIVILRAHHTPAANPPSVNIQDCSQPSLQSSGVYSQSQEMGTPRKWSASPIRMGYTPVVDRGPRPSSESLRAGSQETDMLRAEPATTHIPSTEGADGREREISSVPATSDCLHSSEDCVQFQMKKEGAKGRGRQKKDYFSTLPLDTDTSETCSVYSSDKLNFL